VEEELKRLHKFNPMGKEMDMGDSWHAIDDSDDSNVSSTVGKGSQVALKSLTYQQAKLMP
jgi:hypothetical protein